MDLVNEMYFAILLDRASGGPVIIACSEGGTSIEDLAEESPEKIVKVGPACIFTNLGLKDCLRGRRLCDARSIVLYNPPN